VVSYNAQINLILKAKNALATLAKFEKQLNGILDSNKKLDAIARRTNTTAEQYSKKAAEALEVFKKSAKQKNIQLKIDQNILQKQIKLNSAATLFERRVKQINRAGGTRNKAQEKELADLQRIVSGNKENLGLLNAAATAAGRLLEIIREENRVDKSKARYMSINTELIKRLDIYRQLGVTEGRLRKLVESQVRFYKEIGELQLDIAAAEKERFERLAKSLDTELGLTTAKQKNLRIAELQAEAAERQLRARLALAALEVRGPAISRNLPQLPPSLPNVSRLSPNVVPDYFTQLQQASGRLLPGTVTSLEGLPSMSGGARPRLNFNRSETEFLGGRRTLDDALYALRAVQNIPQSPLPPQAVAQQLQQALPSTDQLAQRLQQTAIQRGADFANGAQLLEALRLRPGEFLPGTRAEGRVPGSLGGTQYKSPVGPQPAKRPPLSGFANTFTQLGLGAGFPLLFGGGAGQVAGGALGSIIGTGALGSLGGLGAAAAAGGPAGLGLQIALSAAGGLFEDNITKTKNLQAALSSLNMDALAASSLQVSAELQTIVNELIAAGKYQEAFAEVSKQATIQSGFFPEDLEQAAGQANYLGSAWERFSTSFAATAAVLAGPLLTGLGLILDGMYLINITVNLIAGGIAKITRMIPGVQTALDFIADITFQITDEQRKQIAAAEERVRVAGLENKLQAKTLSLSAQKTAADTASGQILNANLDYEIEMAEIKKNTDEAQREINKKYAFMNGLRGAALNSAKALKNNEETQLIIKDGLLKKEAKLKQLRATAVAFGKQALEATKRQTAELSTQLKVKNELVALEDIGRQDELLSVQQQLKKAQYIKDYKDQLQQVTELINREAQIETERADKRLAGQLNELETQDKILQVQVAQSREAEAKIQKYLDEQGVNEETTNTIKAQLDAQKRNTKELERASEQSKRINDAKRKTLIAQNELNKRQIEITKFETLQAEQARIVTQEYEKRAQAIQAAASRETLTLELRSNLASQQFQFEKGVLQLAIEKAEADGNTVKQKKLMIELAKLEFEEELRKIKVVVQRAGIELRLQQAIEKSIRQKIKENAANVEVVKKLTEALVLQELQTEEASLRLSFAEEEAKVLTKIAKQQLERKIAEAELIDTAASGTERTAAAAGRLASSQQSAAGSAASYAASLAQAERSIGRIETRRATFNFSPEIQEQVRGGRTFRSPEELFGVLREAEKPFNELSEKSRVLAEAQRVQQQSVEALSLGMDAFARRLESYAENIAKSGGVIDAFNASKEESALTPFATGGYVSSPTPALIGEAGPEYVIREDQMKEALVRYASGKRGDAVIPDGSTSPSISIKTGPVMQVGGQDYISRADFERGMKEMSASLLTTIRRSPSTRSRLGI